MKQQILFRKTRRFTGYNEALLVVSPRVNGPWHEYLVAIWAHLVREQLPG